MEPGRYPLLGMPVAKENSIPQLCAVPSNGSGCKKIGFDGATMCLNYSALLRMDQVHFLDERIVELSLLLPAAQATALDRLASSGGLTVGQLLRLLIQEYLASLQEDGAAPYDAKSGRNKNGQDM